MLLIVATQALHNGIRGILRQATPYCSFIEFLTELQSVFIPFSYQEKKVQSIDHKLHLKPITL